MHLSCLYLNMEWKYGVRHWKRSIRAHQYGYSSKSVQIINNYWMRSRGIWGIIKAEVCVIYRSRRLRQITQTEALIIPHILREPNSIIVLLFICICEPFPWRSHLYFEFWHKQHKAFVFCIWHRQHKLVWRHKVVYVFRILIRTNYVIMWYMCSQYSMMMS